MNVGGAGGAGAGLAAPARAEVASAAVTDNPMQDKLDDLRQRKDQAYHAGSRAGGRAPARQGQDARPGAHRVPARPGLVPRARPAGPPPRPRRRAGGAALHRRRHHRLGHDRRPQGLRVQPGLHRLRRRPRRGVRREDPQADGPRPQGRRAGHRPQRRRRRPHPGGRRLARQLRRHLLPQRAVVGRRAADQRDPRPVRRRRRLLARP